MTVTADPLMADLVSAYDKDGWCRSQYRFSSLSTGLLRDRVESISRELRPEVVHEKDGETVRAVHGCHTFDDVCAALVCHPYLVALAEALTRKPVYVYQFKVNLKQAREGAAWPWHQDFTFWSTEDGMPRPDAVNLAISLDDTHTRNGPLVVLPGTHRLGIVDPPQQSAPGTQGDWHTHVSTDLAYTVDVARAETLAETHGKTSITGPVGSIHAFHPNIIHSSSNNESPDRRALLLVTYNPVDNAPLNPTRPGFLVDRDTSPLTPRFDKRLTLVGPHHAIQGEGWGDWSEYEG